MADDDIDQGKDADSDAQAEEAEGQQLRVAKKVDEDWKKQAKADKAKFSKQASERDAATDAAEERVLIEFLAVIVQQTQVDLRSGALEQAKFMIDALAVLKKRTQGNLTTKENTLLESAVTELKRAFFQIATQGGGGMGVPPGAPGAVPPPAPPGPGPGPDPAPASAGP